MIEPSLARIMARLDPGKMAIVQQFSDPITLLFGLGLWGLRISQLSPREPKTETPIAAKDNAAPTEKMSGDENENTPVVPSPPESIQVWLGKGITE